MFEWFGLSIIHYVTVRYICLGFGSLRFGCFNNGIILARLAVGVMKLKSNTDQKSSLKLVEVRLLLVGLN